MFLKTLPGPRKISRIFHYVSVLLKQGIALPEALRYFEKELAAPKRSRALAGNLAIIIEKGYSLSEAMDYFPASFPEEFREFIRCGEISGNLPEMLQRCSIMDNHEEWKRFSVSYLIYPLLLCFFASGIVIFMTAAVFPTFFSIGTYLSVTPEQFQLYLEQINIPFVMRHFTVFMDKVLLFFTRHPNITYLFFPLFFGFFYLILNLFKTVPGKKLLYVTRKIIPFYETYLYSNFCNFTGSIMETGMTLEEGLKYFIKNSKSPLLTRAQTAHQKICQGEDPLESFRKANLLDGETLAMLTGNSQENLARDFIQASHYYRNRFLAEMKTFLVWFEPILVACCGLFYSAIAASLYVGLLKISAIVIFSLN